jgi:hypothetical protein
MILTLVLWLIVVEIVWPASVSLYLVPMSVFIIILWLTLLGEGGDHFPPQLTGNRAHENG